MGDVSQIFMAVEADATVAPLVHDGRAAFLFDRAGTRLLWANAAGMMLLGARDAAALGARRIAPASSTARRIAALAGRLTAHEKTERVPLPTGIVPVQAVCLASRVIIADERAILIVATDGTGRIAAADAERRYRSMTAGLRSPAVADAAVVTTPIEGSPPSEAGQVRAVPIPSEPGEDESQDAGGNVRSAVEFSETISEPGGAAVPPGTDAHGPDPFHDDIRDVLAFVNAELGDTASENETAVHGAIEEPAGEGEQEQAESARAAPVQPTDPSAEALGVDSDPDSHPDALATDLRSSSPERKPEHGEVLAEASAPADDRHAAATPVGEAAGFAEMPHADVGGSGVDEPKADAEAAADEALMPAVAETAADFTFPTHGRTIRFVFELDPSLAFSFVSPELAEAVGPVSAGVEGRAWRDVAAAHDLDPLDRIGAAVRRRDTFTGLTVHWPVDVAGLRVPVDLAGMPVFGRDRSFRGYRGFGMARTGSAFAVEVPVAKPAPDELPEAAEATNEAAVDTSLAVANAPAVMPDIEPTIISKGLAATEPLDDVEEIEQGLGADWAGQDLRSAVPVAGNEETEGFGDEQAEWSGIQETPEAGTISSGDALETAVADTGSSGGGFDSEAEVNVRDETEQPERGAAAGEDHGDETWAIDLDRDLEFEIATADAPALIVDETPLVTRPRAGAIPAAEPLTSRDWIEAEVAEARHEPITGADRTDPSELLSSEDDQDDIADLLEIDGFAPGDPTGAKISIEEHDSRPNNDDAGEAVDKTAGEIEPEWHGRTEAATTGEIDRPETGQVIRSPIVPRQLPEDARERERTRLSRPEREAFQKIAEALGARYDGPAPDDDPDREADVPAVAPQSPPFEPPLPRQLLDPSILDKLPIAVAILKDGEAVAVNRCFLETAGYEDFAALEEAGGFGAAFAGSPMPRDASLPAIRRRDGVEIPVHARLHSVPWQGGIASMLVLQETATATGRDRAEIAEARVEELEAILDTATDGVLVLDGRGTILGANRAAEALFGTQRSAMVGESLVNLLAPESHRDALDYLDGLARNGVASVLNDGREVIGRVARGGLVPLFMTIGRVSQAKFCAVLRDITQWKRAEEDLTTAKRSAETASSQKSDFLAKISHEIRTPLNAIIGFSEVMMEERFGPVGSDRYKEYLRDINISGAHIMSLVNDLLDLSKIEAGKLDLSFEAVPLNEVIRECVALMQPQANRERVIIRTSLSSSLPDVVADSRSLRQIVLNLVSNAIKFNNAGGQVIVSTLYEDTGEVAVRVRDTGPGMSEDDIRKALEPFRQLQTARPGRGTGLGLPLTKALVEANRAGFRIDSSVGQGTLVQITFPSTRVLAE